MFRISLAALLILIPVIAVSVTINVPQDYPTIQAGIDAAVDGDTVLIADGTYTGTGNWNIDFQGKAIVVKSANGPGNCIMDCQQSGNGFYFQAQEDSNSIAEEITVMNAGGAGVYCTSNSSPKLLNLTIMHCYNSGIRLVGGHPVIDGCLIFDNIAGSYGGGICLWSSSGPIIRNCYIIGNYGGCGGGIYGMNSADTYISNCYICYNTSSEGGGILKDGGICTWYIEDCVISGNISDNYSGGAIWWHCSSTLNIKRTSFINNITRNWGTTVSFGCYNVSQASFENCTFTGNYNPPHYAVINQDSYILSFQNCLFWDNAQPAFDVSDSANFIVSYCDIEGGYPGTGNIDADPLFVSTDDWDCRLLPESPCIDSGNPDPQYNDPDGTRNDMGSQYYDHSSVLRALLNNKFKPIIVGDAGGNIDISLWVENADSVSHTVSLWQEVITPFTVSHNLVWGAYPLTIDPASIVTRNIQQNLSGSLATGVYSYISYTVTDGDTLIDNCVIIKAQRDTIPFVSSSEAGLNIVNPNGFELKPPYPNPFNQNLTIEFELPSDEYVSLAIYDILGRRAAVLEDGFLNSGRYERVFDCENMSSGIYFVKMKAGEQTDVRKVILMK